MLNIECQNCKFKQQAITAHLSDSLKSKALAMLNIDNDHGIMLLILCWWECKTVTASLDDSLTTKYALIVMHSNNHLLNIYTNMPKTYAHTKIYPWIFIAAVFIISHTGKQSRCYSIGEWINIVLDSYDRILFTLKGNKLTTKTLRNFKCILLLSEKKVFRVLVTVQFWL